MNISMKQLLLFIAYAGFVVVALSGSALNIAWLYIQAEFELPLSAIGGLLSFPAVVQLLVSFYSGRLSQRLGIGKFLLVGSLFCVLGLCGYMLTPSWSLMIIAGMTLGLGNGIMINALNIFVASNYASSRVNWLHASFGLGATLGPILITVVVFDLQSTWRLGYGLIAMVALILSVMVFLTMRHWQLPEVDLVRKTKTPQPKFNRLIVWFSLGVMFLSAGIETGTGQLSGSLLVNGRGFDERTVATWLSVYWLSYTVGRFVTGIIIDRISHNLFMRGMMLFAIVGASLIWLNPSPFFNFVGLAIIGFAMAPVAPTLMADTPDRVGVDRAPNVIGYHSTAAGFGIALLPPLAGIVAEFISLEIIGLYLVLITTGMFVVHELLNYQETNNELIDSRHD